MRWNLNKMKKFSPMKICHCLLEMKKKKFKSLLKWTSKDSMMTMTRLKFDLSLSVFKSRLLDHVKDQYTNSDGFRPHCRCWMFSLVFKGWCPIERPLFFCTVSIYARVGAVLDGHMHCNAGYSKCDVVYAVCPFCNTFSRNGSNFFFSYYFSPKKKCFCLNFCFMRVFGKGSRCMQTWVKNSEHCFVSVYVNQNCWQ